MESSRDVEMLKLFMAAQVILEDAFQDAYRRWQIAGSGTTVRECIAAESADALALCKQLGVPTPDK